MARGGWGLDLEKCGIVRLEYSEVGATGLRTTQRGWGTRGVLTGRIKLGGAAPN